MISVIICTYNHSESLKNNLDSIKKMSIPNDLSWELIVVDNNSKDSTKEVVEEFTRVSGLNVRYVFEEKQGLSHARNRGTEEAKGEIIAFTDDDVLVEKEWVLNIKKAFEVNDVACVGGKILPIWEIPKPRWLTQDLYGYLAILNYGDKLFYLDSPKIWGANFAVKSFVFKKYGYFDTTLGHKGGKLYGGEEVEFIERIIKNGEKVLYYPDILVHHCIPSYRMRKPYFRKWFYDKGELEAIQMGNYPHRNFMGVPLYILRRLIKTLPKYIFVRITLNQNGFHEELILFNIIGFIIGRIKSRNA